MAVPKDLQISTPLFDKLPDGSEVTLLPFNSIEETPEPVIETIQKLLNDIIEEGTTYVFKDQLNRQEFLDYYFPYFVAVLVAGRVEAKDRLSLDLNKNQFLGCFYIKPNYIGRSNHVCNGGFLVDIKGRGKRIGSIMGRNYLIWAPMLNFKYSVFNLVYETNVASLKIWDNLGFERIGRIKKAGALKGLGYVDAIMFGYDFEK